MELSGIGNKAITVNLSEKQKTETNYQVNELNEQLKAKGRRGTQNLGQDDFLKLLVTQLRHQDPLSPMTDKDFIAQMAQFSNLKQTTKLNSAMKSLINKVSEGGIHHLLGKKVSWMNETTQRINSGVVESIEKKGTSLKLQVHHQYVDPKDLVKIEVPQANEPKEKK